MANFMNSGQQPYYPVQNQDSLNFQSFDYGNAPEQYGQVDQSTYNSQNNYDPGQVTWSSIKRAFSTGGFDDEPPLLEELGINFSHIASKGLTVMNPFKTIDSHIMDDTDLFGPVIFCLAFGMFLLISGKVHFGYIYGIAMMGCVFMYCILNLMALNGIDIYRVASVLGYSMLPIVILSSASILLQLSGTPGLIASAIAILWSAYSASSMFVIVLEMKEQRFLVAYPVALLYSAFAIVTVF